MTLSRFRLALGIASIASLCGGFAGAVQAEEWKVIHAGTLLAVPGEQPVREASLIVRGERIQTVVAGYVQRPPDAPSGARLEIIDLSERFVLPGLMDAHVHLSFESGTGSPLKAFTESDSEMALTAMTYAQRTLQAGFTTVRDLASGPEILYAVRNSARKGQYPAPRILVSGPPITAAGGHGDFPGLRDDVWENKNRRMSGVCYDAGTCRNAVRLQIKRGSDVIKLMATGGFSSGTGIAAQLTQEEMNAVVEAAHDRNVPVTAHAYALEGIKRAVLAGVDSVEHGIMLDDAVAEMMQSRGTALVPTLMVYRPVEGAVDAERARVSRAAFEAARRRGVTIAFGTDAGVRNRHGSNAHEFTLLVEYGMSPADAIRSATVTTAEMFGISSEAGTLEPGKLADVIAVDGDPLADIGVLEEVMFVMKSGRVVRRLTR